MDAQRRINRYDAQGRLAFQRVLDADGGLAQDIAYTRYDGVGNIRQYQLTQYGDDDFTNTYDITLARFEGYKEELTQGSSSLLQPGRTQQLAPPAPGAAPVHCICKRRMWLALPPHWWRRQRA